MTMFALSPEENFFFCSLFIYLSLIILLFVRNIALGYQVVI